MLGVVVGEDSLLWRVSSQREFQQQINDGDGYENVI